MNTYTVCFKSDVLNTGKTVNIFYTIESKNALSAINKALVKLKEQGANCIKKIDVYGGKPVDNKELVF